MVHGKKELHKTKHNSRVINCMKAALTQTAITEIKTDNVTKSFTTLYCSGAFQLL